MIYELVSRLQAIRDGNGIMYLFMILLVSACSNYVCAIIYSQIVPIIHNPDFFKTDNKRIRYHKFRTFLSVQFNAL